MVIDSAAGSTVTENAFVAVPPPLAWTVKFETPAADGVPLKTPAEESVSPAGSAPDNTDQPYGVVPPVAANVWLYAVPTVPVGSGDDVVIDSAAGSTVTENAFVAVPPPLAWTVKFETPAADGVPLKTPAEESVSPAGSAPDNTDQPYGVVPPVAANVWLYALPTVPVGSGDDVVIDSAAGSTVTENAFVAVPPPLAWTVKFETPAADGVPLKTPAEESVSPAGSAPDNTDQLYGGRTPRRRKRLAVRSYPPCRWAAETTW